MPKANAPPRHAGLRAAGRPDERYVQTPTPFVRLEAEDKQILVSVVATANVTKKEGKIRFVNPVPGGRPSGIEMSSPVLLQVKNETGYALHRYPVLVNIYSELAPEADREGLVDAIISVSPETRMIELEISGKVADTARVGGTGPAVLGVQRVAAYAKDRSILLTLDKELEAGQTFSVQFSTDKGRTWRTVAVGLFGPTFEIDRSQFSEGQELQVRVITTNGLVSSVVVSAPFRV